MPLDKMTQAAIEKGQKEMSEARQELFNRMLDIKRAQQKERDEYLELALFNVMPAWAVNRVLHKKQGWLCHLYRVRIDHWIYDKRAEQFMVFKRNKLVMTKIFKWDDGQHMEGKRL